MTYPDANHGAGIFTYIYPQNGPNVGKYSSTMEHLGYPCTSNQPHHLIPDFGFLFDVLLNMRRGTMWTPCDEFFRGLAPWISSPSTA